MSWCLPSLKVLWFNCKEEALRPLSSLSNSWITFATWISTSRTEQKHSNVTCHLGKGFLDEPETMVNNLLHRQNIFNNKRDAEPFQYSLRLSALQERIPAQEEELHKASEYLSIHGYEEYISKYLSLKLQKASNVHQLMELACPLVIDRCNSLLIQCCYKLKGNSKKFDHVQFHRRWCPVPSSLVFALTNSLL